MMRKLSLCAALLAMVLGAPYLFAGSGSYVMGYSPAGGVTLGQAGGPPYTSAPALFDYSNLNGSAYQSLYYGVNYVANVAQSNAGAPGNMTFQGFNSTTGILAWGSTQPWNFTNSRGRRPGRTNARVIERQPWHSISPPLTSAS